MQGEGGEWLGRKDREWTLKKKVHDLENALLPGKKVGGKWTRQSKIEESQNFKVKKRGGDEE